MDTLIQILKIIAAACFLITLYKKFYNKQPKIRTVKIPTARQIKRRKKRARRLRKLRRRFKIPYVGKTEIIRYDKTSPCINSMWEEVERRK